MIRAVAGHVEALESLLLDCHDRLLRSVRRGMANDLQGGFSAEDVVQDTFVDAFRSIGQVKARTHEAFYHWLRRVAHHRLLDAVKRCRAVKRGGGRRRVRAADADKPHSQATLLDLVEADGRTPSGSVARHEAAAALHVALAGLAPDHRRVLRLRYIEDRAVAEVAARMERTPQAVHMLSRRALDALRQAMGRASRYLSSA